MLILLGILAVVFTSFLIDYKRLEEEYEDALDETPCSTQVFIYQPGSMHMINLIALAVSARTKIGITVMNQRLDHEEKSLVMYFDNGDVIKTFVYGKKTEPFSEYELSTTRARVFFDAKLPKEAIGAICQELGLQNYVVEIGICDENSIGGKENGKDVC